MHEENKGGTGGDTHKRHTSHLRICAVFGCVCIRSSLYRYISDLPLKGRGGCREGQAVSNVRYVVNPCLKRSLLFFFSPVSRQFPVLLMAAAVERDVQEMLLGQRKTKRGQGNVPYPVSEYSTDLANL